MLVFFSISANGADIAINGKLNTWAATTVNTVDKDSKASDSVGFLYVIAELNTTVKLADNVKVVLEIELNDKVSDGASMKSGAKYTGGNGGLSGNSPGGVGGYFSASGTAGIIHGGSGGGGGGGTWATTGLHPQPGAGGGGGSGFIIISAV